MIHPSEPISGTTKLKRQSRSGVLAAKYEAPSEPV
jgi:hypothetical protein